MPESARCTSNSSPVVVAHDGTDRDLGGDVSGHTLADALEPLLHEVVGLATDLGVFGGLGLGLGGRGLDVGGDVEHLLEALPLVQALGEAETRTRDGRQRLAPASQVTGFDLPCGHDRNLLHRVEHGPTDLAPVELVGHELHRTTERT
jgi:hypothetical protein